jgi:plasmid stabilization system protein ParE
LAQVVYSAAALDDLERIMEFLLETSSAQSALGAIDQITKAIDILSAHPRIGRRTRGQMRELVISHGAAGYLALYHFEATRDLVAIDRIRHQREAGYRD